MRIVTPADNHRAVIKADRDGDIWIWVRSNPYHVWANRFTQFPYRNDLHRLMCTIAKDFDKD